jgi:hypothetical protein
LHELTPTDPDRLEALMEADSTDRPESAAAVADQLRQILASLPMTSAGTQPSTTVTKVRRKRRVTKPHLRIAA